MGILRSNKSWGMQLRAAQQESMKTQQGIKSYRIIANKINRCWENYRGLHGWNYSMNEPSPYLGKIWTWTWISMEASMGSLISWEESLREQF